MMLAEMFKIWGLDLPQLQLKQLCDQNSKVLVQKLQGTSLAVGFLVTLDLGIHVLNLQ